MMETGSVTLVGAGPGDPGLLTLAGKAALEEADVVLHDRLIGGGVLRLIPESASRIDVGKRQGSHPVPQEEINDLIVRHALAGKKVVRLKGGDPYLFGRGAEELEAARRHGIPFRVVPGVTSALAVPSYAGIPVTHRNVSSSVHILTGHGKGGSSPEIPYPELARLGGTLVFLMGLSAAADICGGLIAAGMPAATPAAMVEHGTLPDQRTLVSTLDELPRRAAAEAFSSPALLVLGRVCAFADAFDWAARLPLRGRSVLTVTTASTAGRLAEALRRLGCGVDEFHALVRKPALPPERFWREAHAYGWIVFTSPFGAEAFFAGLWERGIDLRALAGVKFAAVGPRTGEALSRRGLIAEYSPETYNGRRLSEGLLERVRDGERVLLFRARNGNRETAAILEAGGVRFDDVAAYDTEPAAMDAAIGERVRRGGYDAVAFTSASSVAAFARALPGVDFSRIPACCIGDMTAAAARECGMPALVAATAGIDAMTDLIMERLSRK